MTSDDAEPVYSTDTSSKSKYKYIRRPIMRAPDLSHDRSTRGDALARRGAAHAATAHQVAHGSLRVAHAAMQSLGAAPLTLLPGPSDLVAPVQEATAA